MKYLVTGTAGFIGFHTALKLLTNSHEVVGIDCINDYYDQRVKYGRLELSGIKKSSIVYGKLCQSESFPNYKFMKLDLEEQNEMSRLFKTHKFDCVIHLAAQAGVRYSLTNPYAYLNSNLNGFLNILENCRHNKIEHLTYASSSSVYGINDKQPFSTSDRVDHPISLYAASKKSNELMAHTYSYLFGLPTTGLRFFTVYGPWGRPDMALFLFTQAMLNNEPINVFNNGNMSRDFTYIDDIVEGIVRVAENPPQVKANWNTSSGNPSESSAPYKIYNIGNNNPVKLMDFIEAIEKNLDIVAKKNFLPLQAGDVPSTYADVHDLIEDLNYKPQTSIEYGISQFIKWYKDFYI